jgi:hypothetical protein
VHDFLFESNDLGGFYSNNGWTSYGNLVRNNFIHHTRHAIGVYLDDGDSGDLVEGNLMYCMGTAAAIGGGHDNVLRGNLAVECPGGFGIDARGVGRKYDAGSSLMKDLAALHVDQPPWSVRYPTLAAIPRNHPEQPTGCVLERNIVVGTGNKAELRGKPEHFQFVSLRDNAEVALEELGFVNPTKMDFRMSPEAAVFRSVPGFAVIPFGKIGLYTNELRKTLPVHASGHTVKEWKGK